ncbi:MAG: hypothetical protein P8N43_02960 [Alphaproteobacteria bacterium]|nr:hypothetical protein [Alphaproteobacteria bacterium]
MAIPMARMVGASVSFLRDRSALHDLLASHDKVFPPGYRPEAPTYAFKIAPLIGAIQAGEDLRYLVPHQSSEALVKDALGPLGRPLVTITWRNSWNTEKNGRTDAWARLAEYITVSGATVINVPDTLDALSASTSPVAAVAAYDPDIRLALYRAADLNLMVNNGPMLYCMFGDAPFMIFKMVQPDVAGVDPDFIREMGFYPGWNWPLQFGRFIFDSDDYNVLVREYDKARAIIPGLRGTISQ